MVSLFPFNNDLESAYKLNLENPILNLISKMTVYIIRQCSTLKKKIVLHEKFNLLFQSGVYLSVDNFKMKQFC